MITSLKIQNFKSFKEIDLKLGKLNFIIGSNASGKSNFMDALRFLQGIGYGFSFSEILDGKPKSAGSEVWEGIRGGSKYVAWDTNYFVFFHVRATYLEDKNGGTSLPFDFDYKLLLNPSTLKFENEILNNTDTTGFITEINNNDAYTLYTYFNRITNSIDRKYSKTDRNSPTLSQNEIFSGDISLTRLYKNSFQRLLSNIQHIFPLSVELRKYSPSHKAKRMGEKGENFASIVNTIIENPLQKEAYLSWLQHLRPEQIEDVKILKGAVGESMFGIVENGRTFPAPVLSDGTLRFAALAAAMFQPDMPAIMTIEEIESGIHPSRLRLLVELLRNRAEQTDTQFFITTHSPVLLSWLKEEEYQHTFYCKRDDATGESKLTPLSEMPHFADAVKTSSLGDLVSEGWMEANL